MMPHEVVKSKPRSCYAASQFAWLQVDLEYEIKDSLPMLFDDEDGNLIKGENCWSYKLEASYDTLISTIYFLFVQTWCSIFKFCHFPTISSSNT